MMSSSIQSMTGFGRSENHNESYQATVEIKSVNNRYKDFRFKMSSLFNFMEMDLKKSLMNEFNRGSFEIFISFKTLDQKGKLSSLDMDKVTSFVETFKTVIQDEKVSLQCSPTDFLKEEFLIERDFASDPELIDIVQQSFKSAVKEFKESRQTEGEKLATVINQYREKYQDHLKVIIDNLDGFKSDVEERLKQRFSEFGKELKVDEPRFLQEVVYYLEKLDISEEIDRINTHLSKLDSLLGNGGEVGRQMDFLIQELNRETNTIGSKSSTADVSEAVVQMKVCLEKIREQALNIE